MHELRNKPSQVCEQGIPENVGNKWFHLLAALAVKAVGTRIS